MVSLAAAVRGDDGVPELARVAAIPAAGYGSDAPGGGIPIVITLTGLVTLVLAPFSLCAQPQRHHRRHLHGQEAAKTLKALRRGGELRAAVRGDRSFGAAVTGVLTAFPKELRWRLPVGAAGNPPAR
jgi:hypothetical protein